MELGSLGTATPALGVLAYTGYESYNYAAEGTNQLFETHQYREGQAVEDSFRSGNNSSYLSEKASSLTTDIAIATGAGKLAGKAIQAAGKVKGALGEALANLKSRNKASLAGSASSPITAPKTTTGSDVVKTELASGTGNNSPGGRNGFVLKEAKDQSGKRNNSLLNSKQSTKNRTSNSSSNSKKGPRYESGIASGGESLRVVNEGDAWFRGTDGNAAKIPKQIAGKMKGMEFKNFDQFRNKFWKLVAGDPVLSKKFDNRDINRMKKGIAPRVHKSQTLGKLESYQLHHNQPIVQGGSVYNFDNLTIVTPKTHGSILDPKYHRGADY